MASLNPFGMLRGLAASADQPPGLPGRPSRSDGSGAARQRWGGPMGITPNPSLSPRRRVDSPVARRDRERDRDQRRDARDERRYASPTDEPTENTERRLHDFDVRLISLDNQFRASSQTAASSSQTLTEQQLAMELLEKRFSDLEN